MPRTVHDRGEVRRSGRRRSSREHELKGVPDAGASILWRRTEIAGAAGSQNSRFVTAMMRAVVAAWPDSGGYLLAARKLVDHPFDPPTSLHVHIAAHPTVGRSKGGMVAIEEVMPPDKSS
jgi:hypothetical protein